MCGSPAPAGPPLRSVIFLLYLLFGAALAAPLSPSDAVSAALSSHPALAQAEAELAAAKGASRQSAFLQQNPEIEAGYAVVGDRIDASISQALSLSGEGLNGHASARDRVSAAEAGLKRAKLQIAADTRVAYVSAVVAHRTAALAGASFELATRQLTATEAKVRVGESSKLDLHLARLEQAKAARELLDSAASEASELAEIATLVRREVAGTDLSADPLEAAPAATNRGSPNERADVRAARFAVDAAEAALRRERSAILPPVRVGAFYEAGSGEVVAGPTVGITLPLWSQNQAEIGAAKGQVGIAEAAFAAAEARASAESTTAANAATLADATMAAVAATDDDGRAALAAIEAGVSSGELDLLTTVLLREQVLSGQLALIQTRGDHSLARIALLLATEDPALLAGGSE